MTDHGPFKPGGRSDKPKVESPNSVAERILGDHDLLTDLSGQVWRYTGSRWIEAPDAYLLNLAFDYDGRQRSTRNRRGEIVAFIRAATVKDGLQWGRVAEYEIAFGVVPWDWTPGADCPAWRAALDDWFGDSEDALDLIDAIEESAGMRSDSMPRYKKALMLLGESNTGESQVLHVFMHAVGIDNTCQLSVDMDDPMVRAVIVGKGLNVMFELPTDAMICDGGFKTMVSTEEPILINPKNVRPFMYVPSAKHLIATNTLPFVNDRSEATFQPTADRAARSRDRGQGARSGRRGGLEGSSERNPPMTDDAGQGEAPVEG
jgi:hypothetical protein